MDCVLVVRAGKDGRLWEAVVELGRLDVSLTVVTCSIWLLLAGSTDDREAIVSVGWLEIVLVRSMVMIERSARELLGAVEADEKLGEGTGSVSTVLVTASTDEVAGDANAEETRIDDAALDDVVI